VASRWRRPPPHPQSPVFMRRVEGMVQTYDRILILQAISEALRQAILSPGATPGSGPRPTVDTAGDMDPSKAVPLLLLGPWSQEPLSAFR